MTRIELPPPSGAFATGGNRHCFVDPGDDTRCIKVSRLDHTPAMRRKMKGFPKRLKPLSSFDDNLEEHRVFSRIERHIGDAAFELVPRCYGFVDTNHGRGLASEMIRDDDGLISMSLKQYIWQHGVTPELNQALDRFSSQWCELGVPSRKLLLHNILVQKKRGHIDRLVVIDGLGWPDMIPLANWLDCLARKKARRRIKGLYEAIDKLLLKKKNNSNYGYHGWLTDEQRHR